MTGSDEEAGLSTSVLPKFQPQGNVTSQHKFCLTCNFLGLSYVYIDNSTLMTTWGSRQPGETWVTCFLLPKFSLVPFSAFGVSSPRLLMGGTRPGC
jgi:hypothetical protein